MALLELKYYSVALQKATAATIILPEIDVAGPYPVLYLLHGLSDDHTIWQRRTSIERYVQDLPLIVVMPDTGRGFYTDAEQGPAWETAIVRDLVNYVDRMFSTIPERHGRAVAGLSMGGYGAIKFALKHASKFSCGISHSGALAFAHYPLNSSPEPGNAWGMEMSRIVGANPVGGDNDLFALAQQLESDKRPAVKIDCGVDDFLIDSNRAFNSHLTQIGYDHTYNEHPGAHTWAYWDDHIQESLWYLRACPQFALGQMLTPAS